MVQLVLTLSEMAEEIVIQMKVGCMLHATDLNATE